MIVSEHEKRVMLKLASKGVPTKVIASSFGVPTQAVAAFKAWRTIRLDAKN